MEIKLYLRMLQRSWWIIVITALAAIIASLLAAFYSPSVYQASSRFIVSPNSGTITGESNVIDSLNTLDKRSIINTYAEVLKSARVYNETVALMQIPASDLKAYSYTAVVLPDTNIIDLTVRGPNSETVVQLANNMGQFAIQYVEGFFPIYNLRLLDSASAPLVVSPLPLRDALIALVLGLVLGAVLALLRELIRTPIANFLQQSSLDGSSQALNRRTFTHRLEAAMTGNKSNMSLCLVQLDGLQQYQGVLPQPTLHQVLRRVTQSLKDLLRGNDIIGRWSDDQFAVLLSGTSGIAAMNTMLRVHKALSSPINTDVSDEPIELVPLIGIAEYKQGDPAEALVQETEQALKRAFQSSKRIYLSE
jgi:diguanylate cyclase (GGDEF)-like protein